VHHLHTGCILVPKIAIATPGVSHTWVAHLPDNKCHLFSSANQPTSAPIWLHAVVRQGEGQDQQICRHTNTPGAQELALHTIKGGFVPHTNVQVRYR
jgi:hypothetical protein